MSWEQAKQSEASQRPTSDLRKSEGSRRGRKDGRTRNCSRSQRLVGQLWLIYIYVPEQIEPHRSVTQANKGREKEGVLGRVQKTVLHEPRLVARSVAHSRRSRTGRRPAAAMHSAMARRERQVSRHVPGTRRQPGCQGAMLAMGPRNWRKCLCGCTQWGLRCCPSWVPRDAAGGRQSWWWGSIHPLANRHVESRNGNLRRADDAVLGRTTRIPSARQPTHPSKLGKAMNGWPSPGTHRGRALAGVHHCIQARQTQPGRCLAC